ncbi:unnamed protein product [Meloidogyne enterolobii]|uniref:Uncharacterized protein n=1 Tax=Meloidogyne enterolobii TaxID=390850 RepID=A0ACB0Y8E2_MELEN
MLYWINHEDLGINHEPVIVKGFEHWDPKKRPYITRGGLKGKYVLLQYHFHWAVDHLEGSEHCIDDKYYPVELHLVHVKEGYTLAEDLEKPDGIAVVGFFMKIGKIGRKMENFERVIKYGKQKRERVQDFWKGQALPILTHWQSLIGILAHIVFEGSRMQE